MSQIEIINRDHINPYPGGQRDFASDCRNDFIVGLEGGWFSGKSWLGANKLISLHIYNAFDDAGNATFVPSVFVAPTYSNALDFGLPHLLDACDKFNIKCVWQAQGSLAQGRFSAPALIFPDLGTKASPSVILVRTGDVPIRITGWTVGVGWGDEAARWKEDRNDPKNDAIIQFIARVRHPAARIRQIIFTYTNEGDTTRVYEELNSGKQKTALYRIRTIDNPAAKEFYERQKLHLSKDLAVQYLDGGVMILKGGRVYPSFRKDLHVNDRLVLKRRRPLHISLDFNIAPGMHAEIGQYFPEEDLLTVVHELHESRMSVKELVPRFGMLVDSLGGWQWEVLEVYGDASGWSSTASTGESCYDILKNGLDKLGYPYVLKVPLSNPPIINRVNTFEVALLDIDKNVHWQCHSRCERLINDLKYHKRKRDGSIDKSDPLLSHASEAEGYRISEVRPIRSERPVVEGRVSVRVN